MKHLTNRISLVLVLVSTVVNTHCQMSSTSDERVLTSDANNFTDALGEKIDSFVLQKMDKEHLPGSAIVVVKDGKVIHINGYGLADVNTGAKVNPDSTIFPVGSISKALTMLAMTKLIDLKETSYEENVKNYFHHIENPFNLKDTLKIEHLLTHTGGFDQFGIQRQVLDFHLPLEERKAKRPSIADFAKNNLRRIRPAGQHFTYDTYGTTLAGVVLEQITGLTYAQSMKELLFKPLEMNLTSVEVEEQNANLLAKGYGFDNQEGYRAMPQEVYKTLPASSIVATPADIGRLLTALTTEVDGEKENLFSDEALKRVFAPMFRPHPEFVGMTHGFWEGNVFGSRPDAYDIRTLGHGGMMLGATSNFIIAPTLNLGVFVVANRDPEAGGGGVSLWEVFNVIFDHYDVKKASLYPIPDEIDSQDLSEYSGNYYSGLFCHTCSEEEFEKGAWPRNRPISIEHTSSYLLKGEQRYIPRGDDVFVRDDGKEMIFFGRNENSEIAFFVSSDDSTSFERMED